jgi:polar amino acid transport system substrate-binding protein
MKITLLLLLLLFSPHLYSEVKETVTLGADLWCPYNCQPNTERPGYVVEIAHSIFTRAGYGFEYKVLPWTRAIKLAENGKISGIIGAGKKETPNFIFPSAPVGISHHTFYTNAFSSWKYNGIDSLRNIQLGVVQSYSYGGLYNKYISIQKNKPFVQSLAGNGSLKRLIAMLVLKRIDVLIEDENVLQYNKKHLGMKEIIVAKGIAFKENVYIAFSPVINSSSLYASIFDEGIKSMNSSGELDTILKKYSVKKFDIDL